MSPQDPNKTMARHYTALARLLASARRSDSASGHPDSSRRWLIFKNHRGQHAGEIYTLAILITTIAIAATLQQASQQLALGGWHWLWITPASIAAAFALIQLTTLAAALIGSLLGSCGFMPSSSPGSRTSFFFLSTLTAYAAWAATSGTWMAPLGYVWLTLVALNIVASVWLAMREHETRH